MTLTNQLDRAHRNQLRNTSAKIQLCKSGGSESCGEHRVTAWVISQNLRLPAGEGSGWIFEESEEKIWVNTHKACHLNKTCHLEGKNMATLPYTFPEVSCYSIAVFPKGFNDWIGLHVIQLMKGWPSTLPPIGHSTKWKQMSQAPVALSLWSSRVHCLLSSFSLQQCSQKNLSVWEETNIQQLCAARASLKGENRLNATGKIRLSCDGKVSGEKLVVKLLSSLSLKLFALAVQVSAWPCSIMFLTSLYWLHFFSPPKCHFRLLSEFRTCQRASLSGRWFYRALGEWKLNIVLEAVHFHQGGVGLLSILGCIGTGNRKGRTEAVSHLIWAQSSIYFEYRKKLKQELLCYVLHSSCPIQYILNDGLGNSDMAEKPK